MALWSTPAPGAGDTTAVVWRASDDTGRVVAIAHPPHRIVSLSPGATALLFAAGGGARVIGTPEFSVEPEAARLIQRIGDSHGFDVERILALHPDLIVAWMDGVSAAQLLPFERAGVPVYQHRVTRLLDLSAAIEHFGMLLHTEDIAHPVAVGLSARIASLKSRYHSGRAPRALLQVWDRPVYTVGGAQLISDALEACGYRNAYAELPDAAPAVSRESIVARNPEVIVALAGDETSAQDWLERWRALPTLRAVRGGRLISFVDARLSRLGPAVVDATEALCALLNTGDHSARLARSLLGGG